MIQENAIVLERKVLDHQENPEGFHVIRVRLAGRTAWRLHCHVEGSKSRDRPGLGSRDGYAGEDVHYLVPLCAQVRPVSGIITS